MLLQNIVRLRFLASTAFLSISSVTSALSLSTGAHLNGGVPWSGGAQLNYAIEPTISYSELQGEEFVRQMMTPISVDTLALFCENGWSIRRIFRLLVQEVNNIENVVATADPGLRPEIHATEFMELLDVLDQLNNRNATEWVVKRNQNNCELTYLMIRDSMTPAMHEAALKFETMLNLKLPTQGSAEYAVTNSARLIDDATISIVTRSMSDILFFCSHGVHAPEALQTSGVAPTTITRDGTVFDWLPVFKGLFTVQNVRREPLHASLRVYHRGYWFYIEPNDTNTKATMRLLRLLMHLQSGTSLVAPPTLTLPVRH